MYPSNRPDRTPLPVLGSVTSGTAIEDAAREYVGNGEALATFLGDLEFACHSLGLPPPSKEVVKTASLAWADEMLIKLEGVACEDPLTGLSSAEHLRVHVSTLYRTGDAERTERVLAAHALVVVSLLDADPTAAKADELEAAFDHELRLATTGEAIRAVFDRCDVLGTLGRNRVLAVIGRDELFQTRIDELTHLLRRLLPVSSAPRVFVDAMPSTEAAAYALLDDLTS